MLGLARKADANNILEALSRSQAMIEFDLDGNILTANENFCSALGYQLSEIVGRHHRIFCESEYTASSEYSRFWENLKSGKFVASEFKRIRKDGSPLWIEASYNPILRGGKPYKVVKFATDITAKKIKATEDSAKLAAIARSQAVIEFTPQGEIIHANENFCAGLNYQLSEIIGRHHRMFCDPTYAASAEYSEFWRGLARGEFYANEFVRYGKGGKEVWIQAA